MRLSSRQRGREIQSSVISNPTQIPGSILWLRADLGVTIATGVSTWADQSGNGNNFVQASGTAQPTFSATGGPNNTPTLTFNGSTDQLTCATNFPLTNITLFLVLKYSSLPAQFALPFGTQDSGGGSGWEVGTNASGVRAVLVPNVNSSTDGSGTTNNEKWTVQSSSNNWTMRVNGASQSLSVTAMTALSGSGGSTIGNRTGAINLWFPGNIAEVILYNSALTTTQILQVEAYLLGRYGL